MPRRGPVGAGTARLVALQVLDREGPPAHRLGLGQLASEGTDSGRRVGAFRNHRRVTLRED